MPFSRLKWIDDNEGETRNQVGTLNLPGWTKANDEEDDDGGGTGLEWKGNSFSNGDISMSTYAGIRSVWTGGFRVPMLEKRGCNGWGMLSRGLWYWSIGGGRVSCGCCCRPVGLIPPARSCVRTNPPSWDEPWLGSPPRPLIVCIDTRFFSERNLPKSPISETRSKQILVNHWKCPFENQNRRVVCVSSVSELISLRQDALGKG